IPLQHWAGVIQYPFFGRHPAAIAIPPMGIAGAIAMPPMGIAGPIAMPPMGIAGPIAMPPMGIPAAIPYLGIHVPCTIFMAFFTQSRPGQHVLNKSIPQYFPTLWQEELCPPIKSDSMNKKPHQQ
ncbi:hypothetical protein Ciccas_013591, partial [Cichlidogyrus casuarinus]